MRIFPIVASSVKWRKEVPRIGVRILKASYITHDKYSRSATDSRFTISSMSWNLVFVLSFVEGWFCVITLNSSLIFFRLAESYVQWDTIVSVANWVVNVAAEKKSSISSIMSSSVKTSGFCMKRESKSTPSGTLLFLSPDRLYRTYFRIPSRIRWPFAA